MGHQWRSMGCLMMLQNLRVPILSLDKPDMEVVLFTNDTQGGDEI